jgi:hypothetical protein
MSGTPKYLPRQKSCPIDAEEHAAHASRAHGFDIDAQWQYGQLPTTDQRNVA